MKKIIFTAILFLTVVGCVSSESQLREALKKNPKIIFDTIEDNPEQFIEVVNKAAQKAQQKHYEKQLADMTEFQNFGFTGTPVILINGVALHGAQKLEELERISKLTVQ